MEKVPYKAIVGCIMCVMITTRLNIMITIGILNQFVQDPRWRAPKSLVEPTWGFNYVELRKVGTWGPLSTSSTKRGGGAC
jgi:hypothetical protein